MSISSSQILTKIKLETQKASEATNSNTMKTHIGHVHLLCELLLESTNPEIEHVTSTKNDITKVEQLITANEQKVMMGSQENSSSKEEIESIFDF